MGSDLLGTVRRALRVLEFLAERGPVTPREIAAGLTLNLSTAYHVLNTLVADGYAVRDDASGIYALGRKVTGLSDAFVRALPRTPRLLTIVRELGDATNESAYLALLQGRDVVVADLVESKQHVRVASLYPGYAENLHARALGKAVLAHCDPTFVASHFREAPPVRLTSRTKTSVDEILAEYALVRKQGYGEEAEEFAEGVCCVAAPFFSGTGAVAGALSVSIPAFRFRPARASARAAVLAAASAATTALAGDVPRYRRG